MVHLCNFIARPLPSLHGRTPHELITGNMPEVSELKWYQPIWYLEPSPFPEQNKHPARCIGLANCIGQAMCYWILPSRPIAQTTMQYVTPQELMVDTVQEKLRALDESLTTEKLSDINHIPEITRLQLYQEDQVVDDMDMETETVDAESISQDQEDIEEDVQDELLLT